MSISKTIDCKQKPDQVVSSNQTMSTKRNSMGSAKESLAEEEPLLLIDPEDEMSPK